MKEKPLKSNKDEIIQFRCNSELLEKLKKKATEEKVTVSECIRKIVKTRLSVYESVTSKPAIRTSQDLSISQDQWDRKKILHDLIYPIVGLVFILLSIKIISKLI